MTRLIRILLTLLSLPMTDATCGAAWTWNGFASGGGWGLGEVGRGGRGFALAMAMIPAGRIENVADDAARVGMRTGRPLARATEGSLAAKSGPMRVTQYFDPKKGAFPVDGKFALSSEATLGNRIVDGVTGPTTWVAPYAADEMSMFRRLMTGVGNRRDFVEFDVLPGELANPPGLKSMLGRYQQVILGQVDLTGRNAVLGTSGFNWPDAGARYGVPAAGAATGGYLLYNSNH